MAHAEVPADLDTTFVRRAIVARAAALLRIQGPVLDSSDQADGGESGADIRIAGHRLDSVDLVELVVTLEAELGVDIAGESGAGGEIGSLSALSDVLIRDADPAILNDFCHIWLATTTATGA